MRRDQLEHAIRTACQIIERPEVIVVGSQAILGSFREDELPADATMSVEVDILPIARRSLCCQALRVQGKGSQLRCSPAGPRLVNAGVIHERLFQRRGKMPARCRPCCDVVGVMERSGLTFRHVASRLAARPRLRDRQRPFRGRVLRGASNEMGILKIMQVS
jgi:hypothetical protein